MKLYTETQLRQALSYARLYKDQIMPNDEIIKKITPIELPLFEDIEAKALEYSTRNDLRKSFFNGALWVKEYILKDNK